MVQKKTAELQGFHRSFKVRAGSSWGRPGLDHPSGRWRDAEPAPQDTHRGSCELPTLRLELPQPGVHCRGGGGGVSRPQSNLKHPGTCRVFLLEAPNRVGDPYICVACRPEPGMCWYGEQGGVQ